MEWSGVESGDVDHMLLSSPSIIKLLAPKL